MQRTLKTEINRILL